ncbi:MAG TPA: hypothetical protein VH593_27065 [Ktedonobacteraceae bacterium]
MEHPVENLMIGLLGQPFRRRMLPELTLLQEEGCIRVVDQLFVRKAPDGQVTMCEVRDTCVEVPPAYESLAVDRMGWMTAEAQARLVVIALNVRTSILG